MDNNNGNQEGDNPTKDAHAESPPALGAQGQQDNASHAYRGGNYSEHKERISEWFRNRFSGHKPLEWLTFGFEVLTFLALCIYSYFSYGQWQAMKDQKVIMQGQLDQMASGSSQTERLIAATQTLAEAAKAQADSTRTLADTAKRTADAAVRSATIAKETLDANGRDFRATMQASVGIEHFIIANPPIQSGKEVKLELLLRNSGKTTARNTVIIEKTELRTSPPVDFDNLPVAITVDIPAGGTRRIVSIIGLNQGSVEGLGPPPRQSIYAYGKFTYDSGFGQVISERFCGFYDPTEPTRMTICGSM